MGYVEVVGYGLALLTAISGWIVSYRQKKRYEEHLLLEGYRIAESLKEKYAKIDEESRQVKVLLTQEINARLSDGRTSHAVDLIDILRRAKAPPKGPASPPPTPHTA